MAKSVHTSIHCDAVAGSSESCAETPVLNAHIIVYGCVCRGLHWRVYGCVCIYTGVHRGVCINVVAGLCTHVYYHV